LTTPTVNYAGVTRLLEPMRKPSDFGAGPVLLDQSWYQSLGGGFGPVSEAIYLLHGLS
jgi:hypothetical protein